MPLEPLSIEERLTLLEQRIHSLPPDTIELKRTPRGEVRLRGPASWVTVVCVTAVSLAAAAVAYWL